MLVGRDKMSLTVYNVGVSLVESVESVGCDDEASVLSCNNEDGVLDGRRQPGQTLCGRCVRSWSEYSEEITEDGDGLGEVSMSVDDTDTRIQCHERCTNIDAGFRSMTHVQ